MTDSYNISKGEVKIKAKLINQVVKCGKYKSRLEEDPDSFCLIAVALHNPKIRRIIQPWRFSKLHQRIKKGHHS